ncbi:MAG: 2-oxo acid dehydrogenase subunit E2 [Gemmatimonadaceae bacterium]|nr:2-oxo acid dehydrogenase subunit E2 [Gemmatimonadaceae bacterium]
MPQMGESIAEGTVSRWLKKVGDTIKRDEPIFEISTDKVDAEIPSPSAGTIVEILITEGQTVAINTVVARLETDAAAAAAAASAPSTAPAAPATPASAPGASAPAASAVVASAPVVASTASSGSLEDRLRTKSSPLVRKIAAEHGVELSALSGSGIAGRVTRKDLDAYLSNRPAAGAAAPAPAGASMYAPAGVESHGPLPTAWPGDVVEPMSKIRKLTSDHMATARRVAAHVTTFWEIDLTRVARIRTAMRKDFEAQSGQKLTYMPFILQAVAAQLKRHPVLNAAVAGNDIIYRKQINLGIAVALEPTGLIVPVLKRADELSLTGLSRGVNDLAARARGKKLSPTDVQDATFTISNPGTFGSITGTPIIPVGTTAILCLGTIEKRAKVVTGPDGEDTIAIRTCCYFSLSFDHKVVDGADADRFMSDIKRTLESVPETGL